MYVSRDDARSDATERDRQVQPEDQRTDMGRSGAEQDQDRSGGAEDVRPVRSRTIDARRPYQLHRRTFTLRTSEIETMADIGKFRAIDAKDLDEFGYAGDRKHLEADLANLRKHGLILEREVPRHETRPRRLVALTKEGRRLLAATNTVSKGQALYYGFTKPREAHHDADLYRLYQRGMEKVQREGGTNVRVVLDAELKRNLYRDSAKAEREGKSDQAQSEVAEKHGLQVVGGKIPVPDLRIIFSDSKGRLWVGQKGLYLLDAARDSFRLYTDLGGLSNEFIKGIAEDEQGNLWIASRAVPALAQLHAIRIWAGMNVNIDRAPILGEVPGLPGFYNCVSSNGYTLAPVLSRLTTEMLAGRSTSLPVGPFSLARFGPG